MSLLTPTEAPTVHLEMLPSRAKAVRVTTSPTAIRIACWASGEYAMETDGSGSTEDDFVASFCEDCQWHTEEIENYADGEEVNGLQILGRYYTESPCPCYQNGLSHVSFPCEEGYTFDPDSSYDELCTDHIRMDIALDPKSYLPRIFFGMQQGCRVEEDGLVYLTGTYPAVNCFNDDHVCWGDNSEPNDLADAFTIYLESEANQDLTSYEEHERGARSIASNACTYCKDAIALDQDVDRAKALIVASSKADPSAFLLVGASGGHISGYTASMPVYYYPNVEVRPDTTANVWATDVLSTNTRLLFMQQTTEDDFPYTLFIGQVPSTFSLEPCKSRLPQLSEQAELVNT